MHYVIESVLRIFTDKWYLSPYQEKNKKRLFNIREFTTKEEKDFFLAEEFLKKYRECENNTEKIRFVSKLNDKNKNLLFDVLDNVQIEEYRRISANLIEKRFGIIKRYMGLFEYLTKKPQQIQYSYLYKNYKDIDLSIAVYSMKSIIDIMGESKFLIDDRSAKATKKSLEYYKICRKIWDNIWWDTGTQHLLKEDIEYENSSQYYLDANKVITIADIRKKLHKMKIKDFSKKYNMDILNTLEEEIKRKQKKIV